MASLAALRATSVPSSSASAAAGGRIANALANYGSQVAQTPDTFRNALREIGILLDEGQLAEIIVTVLGWNTAYLEVLADVLAHECRGLDWTLVVQRLDVPSLVVRSEMDFLLITRLFTLISGVVFPASGLLGQWSNRQAQLTLLVLAAQNTRGLVDFSSLVSGEQRIADVPVPQNLAWMCLPLYSALLDLASRGHTQDVLEVLHAAAESFPEYVTCFLAQVQDTSNNVRVEILRRTLPKFTGLAGARSTSLAVMRRLQVVNPDLLVLLFRIAFKRAATSQDIFDTDSRLKATGPAIIRKLEEESSPEELLGYVSRDR